ncbi:MAG: PorV/PorQ family protein [Candidatus Saganbacteria bacterium]|nr:PorV/PorQ family protein [Candidatus Saganbacteria bacterium]
MKKSWILFVVLCLLSVSTAVYAKSAGTTSGEFLNIGVGAGPVGMGEAGAALVHGTDALYWNPAGIADQELVEIMSMYSDWFADISFQHVAFVFPIKRVGPVGLSYSLLNYGTITSYDVNGASTGEVSAADYAVTLSYAKRINKKLALGLNVKYISETLDTTNASSVGLDAGLIYNFRPNVAFGAVIKNQLAKLKFISAEASVPQNITVGLGIRQFIVEPLTVAIDYNLSNSLDNYLNFGAEYDLSDYFTLRLGSSQSRLQGGLGFRAPSYNIDYAFVPYSYLGSTHRVSFSLKFGISRQEEIDRHYKKGKAFYRSRKYLDALGEFKKVLEIDSLNRDSREFVDRIVEEMRKETLQEKIKALIAQKKEAKELLKKAILAFQERDYAAAKDYVDQSLSHDPKYSRAIKLKKRLDKILKIK